MPIKRCKICGKKFYVRPSHLRKGWGSYCSQECQYKGYENGIFVSCATCGKKVYRTPHELRHSVSKKYFCNKKCFAVWKNKHILIGEKHPSWKNGEGSYRKIMLRSKIPAVCSKCGIDDIRVLLTHHLDGNRKNNKIKNLEWLCRNCHYLIHNRKTI
jgi:hypothetical protein